MKEVLTFRGINVDVLTTTEVSAGMLILEIECPFTASTRISEMIDTFQGDWLVSGGGNCARWRRHCRKLRFKNSGVLRSDTTFSFRRTVISALSRAACCHECSSKYNVLFPVWLGFFYFLFFFRCIKKKRLLARKQTAASVNPGLALPRVCSNG